MPWSWLDEMRSSQLLVTCICPVMTRWKIQQSDTSSALLATSSAPIQSGVSRSAGVSRPQPIPDVLQLPLQRGPLELLHHALAQKRHVGAAIGLALE
jgi:hypothetical protein